MLIVLSGTVLYFNCEQHWLWHLTLSLPNFSFQVVLMAHLVQRIVFNRIKDLWKNLLVILS
jgi:hypothetical protein